MIPHATTLIAALTLGATVAGGIALGTGDTLGPSQPDVDRAAVEETVRLYLQGEVDRSVEKLERAFHPGAELLTAGDDGTLDVLTQEAWHESVRATPDRERPQTEILSVDVHGEAAMAKTRLTFSDGRYTDYLSLLKLDDGWVVVNKIYHWDDR